jgi:NhaA family Na+:H+ antiporter
MHQSLDKWLINPVSRFIHNSTSSSKVLFLFTGLAIILSNSFLADSFLGFWDQKFTIGFSPDYVISKPLLLWINDGLMSVFFFVVGLELKREIVAGELANPKKAILPIIAGIGGMAIPALIYWLFNYSQGGESSTGWGIPMATDIAFALGVLYMLGNRVPLSLKIFLTALAIIDDLGAVLIIAFFYTSEISLGNLGIGFLFLLAMMGGNLLGVRSALFYGILGIGGLWLAFLLSGVHATIAAVLAAFTIPANLTISRAAYQKKMNMLLHKYSKVSEEGRKINTKEEQEIISKIKEVTKGALTPLQKLEHTLHPIVAFGVLPIFALANAGVTFSGDLSESLSNPVTMGIGFGLLIGKVVGIAGSIYLFERLRLIKLPDGLTHLHFLGVAFLGGIGFTMSLFITSLAFDNEQNIIFSKIGIFIASLTAGLMGYLVLRKACTKTTKV